MAAVTFSVVRYFRVHVQQVGGVIHRVTYTWRLLGLAVKRHGLDSRPDYMDRLRKHHSHLAGGCTVLARKAACFDSERWSDLRK